MRIIFIAILLFISSFTYAHQDFIWLINRKNIHFSYKTGWDEFEINEKVDILLHLLAKLVETKDHNHEQIYIYFNHNYTNRDSSYLALGYSPFTYREDYEKGKPTKEITTTGLKLVINERDFDIKELLNLVNSAFENVNFIKTNQEELIIDKHYIKNGVPQYDTLFSILPIHISKYLASSDTTIDQLINEKTYRHLKKVERSREIDYYYKNNKFHFYNTREPNTKWSKELEKHVVTNSYGEDILVVENIHEIIGNFNDGHFVFINDSTFYYIPQLKDKVRGPFKVDDVVTGRQPIHEYYSEYMGSKRFNIFFYNYSGYNKTVFFPDSNLVISNYNKLEEDFINELFNKKKTSQPNITYNIKLSFLLLVLVLSIVLNVWFLMRNVKN